MWVLFVEWEVGGVLVDGESFFSRVVGGGSLIVEERVFFQ